VMLAVGTRCFEAGKQGKQIQLWLPWLLPTSIRHLLVCWLLFLCTS
jgi:hypothetical protein